MPGGLCYHEYVLVRPGVSATEDSTRALVA